MNYETSSLGCPLSDKSKVTSGLIADERGLHFSIELTARNSGRLPAINVLIETKAVLGDGYVDIPRRFIQKEQKRVISPPDDILSQNIFPSDESIFSYDIYFY